MRVLKVVAEGVTTSFRRPHFMIGIQPTFRMPPPSTIYGHVCSALGELVPPEGIAFAYHFRAISSFYDLEHVHMVASSGGKLKGTSHPKVQEGSIQPYKRELLFQPRLTLYLNRPEWFEAFRHPRFAVTLGRSQDLFTYTSVEQIELQQEPVAYVEHTILPHTMAPVVGRGLTELLPRYLEHTHTGVSTSARYVLLEDRVHSSAFWEEEDLSGSRLFWVDPTTAVDAGAHLGLFFHTFVGDAYEAVSLA